MPVAASLNYLAPPEAPPEGKPAYYIYRAPEGTVLPKNSPHSVLIHDAREVAEKLSLDHG